jgi:glucan phosphoethanolaminetransferase (alkaline phosphatase superfamily)
MCLCANEPSSGLSPFLASVSEYFLANQFSVGNNLHYKISFFAFLRSFVLRCHHKQTATHMRAFLQTSNVQYVANQYYFQKCNSILKNQYFYHHKEKAVTMKILTTSFYKTVAHFSWKPSATKFANDEKTIVFLVIGESAREQNFSLYGYSRATNPLMTELGAVALANSRACASYTTASLLCMLSHIDMHWQLSASYEPLPSYLQRQGIDVIWRTNNWGEPSLKVQSYDRAGDLRRECEGGVCAYDEVLLQGLEQRIRSSTNKRIFVVLHLHGSHGPSYYRNYPLQFEIYKPACKSVNLHECTDAELVSAYDNTILYTDYFLHQAIELLKTFPEHASMLMYISDHGESLGEHGIYLHGSPYSIAPDVQKNVPFLIWMSDTFKQKN